MAMEGRTSAYGRVRFGNLPSIATDFVPLFLKPVVLFEDLVDLLRRLVQRRLRAQLPAEGLLKGGVGDVADLDKAAQENPPSGWCVRSCLDLLEGRLVVRILLEQALIPQEFFRGVGRGEVSRVLVPLGGLLGLPDILE